VFTTNDAQQERKQVLRTQPAAVRVIEALTRPRHARRRLRLGLPQALRRRRYILGLLQAAQPGSAIAEPGKDLCPSADRDW
jgi:hypothetical protein